MSWGTWARRLLDRGPHSGRSSVAEVDAASLGVHRPVATTWLERRGEEHLQTLVGGDGRLVVVRGPALSGKTHLLARAVRLLLGDHVVVWSDLVGVDGLDALIGRAGEIDDDVVVWADDAPPPALDRLTPDLLSSLPEGVRLFVTCRDERTPTIFPDARTAALLDDGRVTVRVGPLDPDEAARAEELGVPAPDGLLGAGERLDAVRRAMTPREPGHLPSEMVALRGAVDRYRLGCPETVADEGARRIVVDRRPLLATVRRGGVDVGVVDPLGAVVADEPGGPAAWTPRPAFVEESSRVAAGRVALSRGELPLARALLAGGDPAIMPPRLALDVAEPATWSVDRRRAWLRRGLEDDELRPRAHRALARLEEDAGDLPAAREHLRALSDDPTVWSSLARIALAEDDVVGARRWCLRIVDEDGPDRTTALRDLAAIALRTDDLDGARRWFAAALDDDPAGEARRRWARAELRLGDLARAQTLAEDSPRRDDRGRTLAAGIAVLNGDVRRGTELLSALGGRATVAGALRRLVSQRHWTAMRLLLTDDALDTAGETTLYLLGTALEAEWSASNSEARWKYQDLIDDAESPEVVVGVACARLARMNLLADRDSVRRCRARMAASTHPGVRELEDEFSREFDDAIRNYLWR